MYQLLKGVQLGQHRLNRNNTRFVLPVKHEEPTNLAQLLRQRKYLFHVCSVDIYSQYLLSQYVFRCSAYEVCTTIRLDGDTYSTRRWITLEIFFNWLDQLVHKFEFAVGPTRNVELSAIFLHYRQSHIQLLSGLIDRKIVNLCWILCF